MWWGSVIDLVVRLFGVAALDERRAELVKKERALRKVIDEHEKRKARILHDLRIAERKLESLYDRTRVVAMRRRALDPNPYGRADDDTCSISTADCEYTEDATPVERPSIPSRQGDKAPE